MSLRRTFANNLKLFRTQKNLTQAQLAEKCNIATNYVGEIEKEKKFPSVEVIEKLSCALNVPPYILFYEYGSHPSLIDDENFRLKWEQEEKQEISQEIFAAVQKILKSH